MADRACCTTGHLHKGTPRGRVQKLYGLDTYVTTGSTAAVTVVCIADLWGPHLPNLQLLCDELSQATGFRFVSPDVCEGDWIVPELRKSIAPQHSDPEPSEAQQAQAGETLGPWLERHDDAITMPILENFMSQLQADPEVKTIGAVGFCWSARLCVLLGQKTNKFNIRAIVTNHPSRVEVPHEWEGLAVPTQINVGDNDSLMPLDQVKEAEKILAKKSNCEVNIMPGAAHGFSIRGDQNNDEERGHKEQAAVNATRFLKLHLS